MTIRLLVLMMLLLSACSSKGALRPDCEGHLTPINLVGAPGSREVDGGLSDTAPKATAAVEGGPDER
ncbi:MAG: hypothetical protein ABI645_01160 [Pseudomonadota bacterium]